MGRWIAVPVAAALLAGLPGVAQAVTLKFDCVERDTPANAAMRLTYDGDDSVTLRVEASFGTFILAATKVEPAGQMAMGIRAFGSASVRMPEQGGVHKSLRQHAGWVGAILRRQQTVEAVVGVRPALFGFSGRRDCYGRPRPP
jgi:hypothetical protein